MKATVCGGGWRGSLTIVAGVFVVVGGYKRADQEEDKLREPHDDEGESIAGGGGEDVAENK